MAATQSRQGVWQNRIEPELGQTGREILKQFPEAREHSMIEQAAAIHAYVVQNIEGDGRDFGSGNPRPFRTPYEALDLGRGNCQEKTVLIASLLRAVSGVRVRTIGLEHPKKSVGHRIVDMKFPYHPKDVRDTLKRFYRRSNCFDSPIEKIGYRHDETESFAWVVADTNRECMGDLGFLWKVGYIVESGDTWDWYRYKDRYDL